MKNTTKHLVTLFAIFITVSVNAQWGFNPSSISTIMGVQTTASDYASLAIGHYNTDDTTPNPGSFSLENRAFIIGNGSDGSNKSDAMTVLFDGTTTIAGSVTAKHFITGLSEATGALSTALGEASTASGHSSFATGGVSIASGSNSTAMGDSSTASGSSSFAMGNGTASGYSSFATGRETIASGTLSFAMGEGTIASGGASTAMGISSSASGILSFAMGEGTIASGRSSTAMGEGTTASDRLTLAIGRSNTDDTTPNPGSFSLENRAFIIGNGTFSNKSDAMTILFDGTTTIAGSVTATSFIGDGSLLTNLPADSDDQQLSLDENFFILELEDGGSVDLSFFDNPGTDDQQLTITGNLLGLENSESVDLSDYLDNTDNQNISGSVLTGTTLTLGIEGGTSENIDLNPLLVNLQAQIDAQQIIIDDLIARMIIREDCKCNNNGNANGKSNSKNNKSIGDGNSKAPSSSALLINNIPNPFDNSTSIEYFVPVISSKANIVISSSTGQILKNITISKFGKGSIDVNKDGLNSAIYNYTLYVDGKQIDSKRMIVK